MSEIVPYQDKRLERIPGKELIDPELLKKNLPRFFLASPVYVGKYNQAGFVIVDRSPEQRPFWAGSDILRYTPEEVEKDIESGEIPEEKRFFYDTTGGMAALRYFAISDIINNVLEQDEYLGPAMVRKFCEEGVVPEEFEELAVRKEGRESIGEYDHFTWIDNGLKELIDRVISPLKERTGSNYRSQSYVTYFPTVAYPIIVPTLEESVKAVVLKFDEFGDRFISGKHDEVQQNPLLLE